MFNSCSGLKGSLLNKVRSFHRSHGYGRLNLWPSCFWRGDGGGGGCRGADLQVLSVNSIEGLVSVHHGTKHHRLQETKARGEHEAG